MRHLFRLKPADELNLKDFEEQSHLIEVIVAVLSVALFVLLLVFSFYPF